MTPYLHDAISVFNNGPPGPKAARPAEAWSRPSGTAGARTCPESCSRAGTARRPSDARCRARGSRGQSRLTGFAGSRASLRRRPTSNLGAIFCGLYDTFRIGTSPPSSGCAKTRTGPNHHDLSASRVLCHAHARAQCRTGSNPASILMNVVLPVPFWPSMTMISESVNSPASIWSEKSPETCSAASLH